MFDQLFGVPIKLTNAALHTIKIDAVEYFVEREYQFKLFGKNVMRLLRNVSNANIKHSDRTTNEGFSYLFFWLH